MQRKEQGFTLIELMITIAIFAIIATMAAPSFSDMMLSQNLNKSTQDLILTLNEARSQAVTKRMPIEIYIAAENKDYKYIVDNKLTAVQRDNLTRKTFFLWKPEGKAQLKTGLPISLLFDFNGGVCISDSASQPSQPKCLRPLDQNTDVFQICNKLGGTKSKTVSLSRMGTIQQITEGTC